MNNILKEADITEIDKIIKLLNQAEKLLKEKHSNSTNDLFEYYELAFLKSYITLYSKIYINKDNIFTVFSFRTLLEMGIEDSFIIFNPSVPQKERRSYMLLIILAEYGFTSSQNAKFKAIFEELFNKNVSLLTPLQILQFKQYERSLLIKKIDKNYLKKLRDVRRIIFNKKKEIINRRMMKNSESIDVDLLLSGHSHILHGNPFLLQQLFESKEFIQTILSYLKISGSEVLQNLELFLKNERFSTEVDLLSSRI